MKTVQLRLNIGRPDAQRLGLDHAEALDGRTVTVKDEAADEMLRKGWATDAPAPAPAGAAPKPDTSAKPVQSADLREVPGAHATAIPDFGHAPKAAEDKGPDRAGKPR